jgi:hypothetical protein
MIKGYGLPPNAKCFIAFQLPDGMIITFGGWTTDLEMSMDREVVYDIPYNTSPLVGDPVYTFKIVMTPQSFNEDQPNWGNIHRPKEIENQKELEGTGEWNGDR